jgi:ubiquinone/menaquinone biosynthesis C-methylase UbiE/rhodanese-related sulfurtransferase
MTTEDLKIDVATLDKWLADKKPVTILDIRPSAQREEGSIPGSIHANVYDKLKANDQHAFDSLTLEQHVPIVTVCSAGGLSLTAAEILKQKGFDAFSLEGGMKAWTISHTTQHSNIMNTTDNGLRFTGSVPKNYDEYLGPMFFEPYAIDLASRIDPTSISVALELGCGTGRVTRHLRKTLAPQSMLIASDLSPDMLAVAKDKLKELNIDWRIINAQELPFSDGSVDLIVCSFGYMFVADRPKAFAEALRVLRPGGTLLLSTWSKLEDNEASFVFRKTVKKYLGDSLPESYKLPFSMHDPAPIQESLRQKGFSKVKSEVIEKESFCTSAKIAAEGLTIGGSIYNEIMDRNPAWLGEIQSTVEKELSEKYGAEPMVAPMKAVITQAWK